MSELLRKPKKLDFCADDVAGEAGIDVKVGMDDAAREICRSISGGAGIGRGRPVSADSSYRSLALPARSNRGFKPELSGEIGVIIDDELLDGMRTISGAVRLVSLVFEPSRLSECDMLDLRSIPI